jgi:hypothetical protein
MLQRRDISSLEISFFICFHRSRVGCAGATFPEDDGERETT